MDEEMLISLVRDHGELYDPAHRLYQDHKKRMLAWKKIANTMKLQVHECRDRWRKLRENYRKAMNLREIQKAKGIRKLKPIKHGQIMKFIDFQKDIDEQESQNTGDRKTETNTVGSDSVDPLVLERNYEAAPRPDTVVTFFTNLGETVKTFPEEVQIRVKRDIFKIINEAEEEVMMNRLKYRRI